MAGFSALPNTLTVRSNHCINLLSFADSLEAEEIKDLDAQRIFDMTQSDIVTYATAFAQIKMTGSISSGLKERGIKAIKRVSLLEGMPWTESKIRRKMIDDLQSFEHVID